MKRNWWQIVEDILKLVGPIIGAFAAPHAQNLEGVNDPAEKLKRKAMAEHLRALADELDG